MSVCGPIYQKYRVRTTGMICTFCLGLAEWCCGDYRAIYIYTYIYIFVNRCVYRVIDGSITPASNGEPRIRRQ